MKKSRAALIHLWPSLVVLITITALILLAWHPYPFLQLKNNDQFTMILDAQTGAVIDFLGINPWLGN